MYLDLWIFKKMYLHPPSPEIYSLPVYNGGCLVPLITPLKLPLAHLFSLLLYS